jgi:membrane protein implicated in regulation of membrane protease activity
MTRSLTATSKEEIPAGEEVVVRDVVGNVLTVARPEAPEGAGAG